MRILFALIVLAMGNFSAAEPAMEEPLTSLRRDNEELRKNLGNIERSYSQVENDEKLRTILGSQIENIKRTIEANEKKIAAAHAESGRGSELKADTTVTELLDKNVELLAQKSVYETLRLKAYKQGDTAAGKEFTQEIEKLTTSINANHEEIKRLTPAIENGNSSAGLRSEMAIAHDLLVKDINLHSDCHKVVEGDSTAAAKFKETLGGFISAQATLKEYRTVAFNWLQLAAEAGTNCPQMEAKLIQKMQAANADMQRHLGKMRAQCDLASPQPQVLVPHRQGAVEKKVDELQNAAETHSAPLQTKEAIRRAAQKEKEAKSKRPNK